MEEPYIRAIEAAYAAAPDPSLWQQALQAIADVFGDVGAVLLWYRDDGSIGTIASAGLAAAQKEYQEEGWNRRDIRSIRGVERAIWLQRESVTERHFMTPAELDTEPFYTDFLARHGLRYCLAVGISPDPHVAAAVSVQRATGRAPYSDTELETMTRLGRHVENALRLSIRLLDAELANVGLGEALARIGIGVFALDSLKRIVFTNPAARHLLGDGLAVVNNRLLGTAAPEAAALDAAVERMIHGVADDPAIEAKPILIRRRNAERALVVYVLPVTAASAPTHFLTHTRAIVLVIDPGSGGPADPSVVRDVLGVTLGEARVAALIGAGLPPREAAQKLRITEETARTALKRVFSKVGVSRQSELAVLLTKLVFRHLSH
jgi:DNA-binding CsgD family transcriptional regulator/GAF domain-containing protein